MLHIHCNFGQKTSSSIKKAFFALLVLKWLSNLEFWRPKKKDQVARIGVMGGGLGDSGNARKKMFFFHWCLPLYLNIFNSFLIWGWAKKCSVLGAPNLGASWSGQGHLTITTLPHSFAAMASDLRPQSFQTFSIQKINLQLLVIYSYKNCRLSKF